jgi:hypothetical protein
MKNRFNWKKVLLQASLLLLVVLIDNIWVDLLFMTYILWDLAHWAHDRHFGTGWTNYLDTRVQQ